MTATAGRARGPLVLAAALALLAGCEDLRQFSGRWQGRISPDPAHQTGFGAAASLGVVVNAVSRYDIDATLTLPGQAGGLRFEQIRQVTHDVLADLDLPGDPLRTYLGFVRPPGEEPLLTVISLYAEQRIEVRLIRGPETAYGVFFLGRPKIENLNQQDRP